MTSQRVVALLSLAAWPNTKRYFYEMDETKATRKMAYEDFVGIYADNARGILVATKTKLVEILTCYEINGGYFFMVGEE